MRYSRIPVLDLSAAALAAARQRLAASASVVQWLEANVTDVGLPRCLRCVARPGAVFHFLTSAR